MARLTRAESQARTRQQLIATARELFMRQGLARTSLEQVAETAGYSRGAVYANFANKEELCLAVLAEVFADELQAVAAAFAEGGIDARLATLAGWAQRMIGDEGWTGLSAEFAAHARHDPDLRAKLAAFDEQVRGTISGALRDTIDELQLQPAMGPDELATTFFSLAIGLGMQRAIDPTISTDALISTLRILIDPRSHHDAR